MSHSQLSAAAIEAATEHLSSERAIDDLLGFEHAVIDRDDERVVTVEVGPSDRPVLALMVAGERKLLAVALRIMEAWHDQEKLRLRLVASRPTEQHSSRSQLTRYVAQRGRDIAFAIVLGQTDLRVAHAAWGTMRVRLRLTRDAAIGPAERLPIEVGDALADQLTTLHILSRPFAEHGESVRVARVGTLRPDEVGCTEELEVVHDIAVPSEQVIHELGQLASNLLDQVPQPRYDARVEHLYGVEPAAVSPTEPYLERLVSAVAPHWPIDQSVLASSRKDGFPLGQLTVPAVALGPRGCDGEPCTGSLAELAAVLDGFLAAVAAEPPEPVGPHPNAPVRNGSITFAPATGYFERRAELGEPLVSWVSPPLRALVAALVRAGGAGVPVADLGKYLEGSSVSPDGSERALRHLFGDLCERTPERDRLCLRT